MREAVCSLGFEVAVIAASAVYETAPMYVMDQAPFLNAALLARTTLAPLPLLRHLKEIESAVGRRPGRHYGPREIDLDLVGYGALAYRFADKEGVRLQVPHPRTPERRFVLQPLADVAPNFYLPGLGSVESLLKQTEEQAPSVLRIENALLPV